MGNLVPQRNKNREFQSVAPLLAADSKQQQPQPASKKSRTVQRENGQATAGAGADTNEVRGAEAVGASGKSRDRRRADATSAAHLTLTEEHLSSTQLQAGTSSSIKAGAVNAAPFAGAEAGGHVEPFTPGHTDFTLTESQQRRSRMADCEFECSEIYPYLFVSGHHVAGNREVLQSHGITHIVNCSAAVVDNYFENDAELKLKYLSLSMVDGRQDDISWFFCDVITFIMDVMTSGGKVLVHCEKGISRSCSFIIAHRMWLSGTRLLISLISIIKILSTNTYLTQCMHLSYCGCGFGR